MKKRTTPASRKAKVCQFCQEKTGYIDYKNLRLLQRYISQYAKIQPKYYTGVCLNHQKKLGSAIKRARFIALLPFVR